MASLSQLIVSLTLFAIFLVFVYKWRCNEASKPGKKLPPSPRKLPLIGNFHQIGALPHRSLQPLSRRYGPLILLHFGKVPVLVASSADAAREIMKNQDLIFSNRPKSSIPDKLLYGSTDVAFAPYGEYWRQIRSICVLHLLSNKRVQSFRRVREEETSLMIENIKRLGRSSSRVINLSKLLASLTNSVVCRAALGRKYAEGDKLRKLLKEFVQLMGSSCIGDYIPWLSWIDRVNGLHAKLDKVAIEFDEFLEGVVKEHRDQEFINEKIVVGEDFKELDFVDILLEFQRETKDNGHIEDNSIKAIILDMFAAGTDTTSTAIEWAVIELLRHPGSMKKLQDEVRAIGSTKGEITESDLGKMQFLKLVMKESLRLHAPIPLLVPRESTKDTKIMGYDIASGTQVIINSWAIGRDPSLWEHPEEFRPERFLDTNADYKGLDFELIPFGAGRRGCPGVTFATAVYELTLAKLVHNFDIALPNGENGENLDMSEVNGIAVHRKFPLMITASTPPAS
ncbi:cytochrome P450 71A6-like [Primulina eburnea]|uniref:cytochrome P450 71A6-like n=1 Tax=Primulina eburnea TaxID=1245227 RepID=UPI003C6CAAE2